MEIVHYKILAGAFALRRFTTLELADFTEIDLQTVTNWINNHKNIFVKKNTNETPKQGDTLWKISPDSEEEVYKQLKEQWPIVMNSIKQETSISPKFIKLPSLDTAEGFLEAADETTDSVQNDEYLTLSHVWLRTAKDTLNEWKETGIVVPEEIGRRITEAKIKLRAKHSLSVLTDIQSVGAYAKWLLNDACRGMADLDENHMSQKADNIMAVGNTLLKPQRALFYGGIVTTLTLAHDKPDKYPENMHFLLFFLSEGIPPKSLVRAMTLIFSEESNVTIQEKMLILLGMPYCSCIKEDDNILNWFINLQKSPAWQPDFASCYYKAARGFPCLNLSKIDSVSLKQDIKNTINQPKQSSEIVSEETIEFGIEESNNVPKSDENIDSYSKNFKTPIEKFKEFEITPA